MGDATVSIYKHDPDRSHTYRVNGLRGIVKTGFVSQQFPIAGASSASTASARGKSTASARGKKSSAKADIRHIRSLVEGESGMAIEIFFFNTSNDNESIYTSFNASPAVKALKNELYPHLTEENKSKIDLDEDVDNVSIAIFPMGTFSRHTGALNLFEKKNTLFFQHEMNNNIKVGYAAGKKSGGSKTRKLKKKLKRNLKKKLKRKTRRVNKK